MHACVRPTFFFFCSFSFSQFFTPPELATRFRASVMILLVRRILHHQAWLRCRRPRLASYLVYVHKCELSKSPLVPVPRNQVVDNMLDLWAAAEKDMLEEENQYSLKNTGQGLQRVQASLERAQEGCRRLQTRTESGSVFT